MILFMKKIQSKKIESLLEPTMCLAVKDFSDENLFKRIFRFSICSTSASFAKY